MTAPWLLFGFWAEPAYRYRHQAAIKRSLKPPGLQSWLSSHPAVACCKALMTWWWWAVLQSGVPML